MGSGQNGVKSTVDPCSKLIRVKSRLDPSDSIFCWKVVGRKLIAKSIAKKVKDNSFQYRKKCDECGSDGVLHENIVISWDDLRIQRTCPNCDKGSTKEFRTTLRIG